MIAGRTDNEMIEIDTGSPKSQHLRISAIVGMTFGVIAVIVLIILLMWYFVFKQKDGPDKPKDKETPI